MASRGFCVECGINFGLRDPSEAFPNTCVECISKMRPSRLGECDWCERVIQIGTKACFDEYSKLCDVCVSQIPKIEIDNMRIKVKVIAR